MIAKAQRAVGNVTHVFSTHVDKGGVISQEPGAITRQGQEHTSLASSARESAATEPPRLAPKSGRTYQGP